MWRLTCLPLRLTRPTCKLNWNVQKVLLIVPAVMINPTFVYDSLNHQTAGDWKRQGSTKQKWTAIPAKWQATDEQKQAQVVTGPEKPAIASSSRRPELMVSSWSWGWAAVHQQVQGGTRDVKGRETSSRTQQICADWWSTAQLDGGPDVQPS